jgi:hypothetical protein
MLRGDDPSAALVVDFGLMHRSSELCCVQTSSV